MTVFCNQTSIGEIGVSEHNGSITDLYLPNSKTPNDVKESGSPLVKEAFKQLNAYLSGKLKIFSLPLDPAGTPFMQKTWTSLCKIPYGKTASYKDIAIDIGNCKAVRAVGMANNRNPIPIFIPCHRVIGSDGKLVGYGGGLELKRKLLELEAGYFKYSI